VVAKGAPQAIVDLAKPSADTVDKVKQTVAALAAKGSRALGVARSNDGGTTWSVLDKANEKGVKVKMVTGDDTAIAIETARQLGMGTKIIPAADAFPKDMDPNNVPSQIIDAIERADGFARVFPQHKYAIVKALRPAALNEIAELGAAAAGRAIKPSPSTAPKTINPRAQKARLLLLFFPGIISSRF
jgi:H+-transporting ATPase